MAEKIKGWLKFGFKVWIALAIISLIRTIVWNVVGQGAASWIMDPVGNAYALWKSKTDSIA